MYSLAFIVVIASLVIILWGMYKFADWLTNPNHKL
jgi:hypothetical protein